VPIPEFEAALPAAVAWQLTRVLPSGEIDVSGNSRTGVGKEKSYFGTPKNVNYKEIILALHALRHRAQGPGRPRRRRPRLRLRREEQPHDQMIRRLLSALFLAVAARAATPPNIVFILADDLGIGDVSCYNPKSAWQTPQLDRMAQRRPALQRGPFRIIVVHAQPLRAPHRPLRLAW